MQKFLVQLAGENVTTEMTGREPIHGKVRSVSDDTLVMETDDGTWAIRLVHIIAVHHKKESESAVSVSLSNMPQEANSLVVPSLHGVKNSGMTVL